MERFRPALCLTIVLLMPLAGARAIQNQANPASDPQKLWALVVGVSNYTHAEPLMYGASDAKAFSDFLSSPRGGGMPPDHIVTLTEEAASRVGVLHALRNFQKQVRPGDTVYVYVAGHGFTEGNIGYFIPIDGDVDDAASTGVPLAHLKQLVEQGLVQAQIRLMFTDICNAGRIGPERSDLAAKIQNLINEELLKVSPQSGTFLNFLASEPTEYSFEDDKIEGGVFTHMLLDALNGKAVDPGQPIAAARRVVDYVRTEVPLYTMNQQHPRANETFEPTLPLAFLDRPGPAPRVAGIRTTLSLVNAERASFARVEWVDPQTQSKAIHQLPKTSNSIQIGSVSPGELELRFYDAENRDRAVRVKLSPGQNTFDLVTLNLTRGRGPAGVIQTASLSPVVVGPAPQAPPGNDEATLFLRADAQTGIYIDSAFWGNGDANGRLVALGGLAAGTHNLTVIPSPDRERRFRVKLFRGQQIFDVASGELQYMSSVPPPPAQTTTPPGLPAQLQQVYQQFTQALWDERLIAPTGNSAWDYYTQLRDAVPANLRDNLSQRLLLAMGHRAQQTILKYLRGGDVRWSAGVFEEGAALTARVRELFETLPEFSSQENFFNGRAMLERGQYAPAVPVLQRSIDAYPQAAYAYNALGLAYWKQNLLSQAIPPLQQASMLSPRWNYPRNTLALIYFEERRYAESEQAFQGSLQVNAEDSTAHHGLGQLYMLLGRLDDAEQRLQRAIEFNPGNAYAHNTYGKLYQRRGQLADAERMIQLAIRLEPDELAFRASLADLRRAQGRIPDAQTEFARLANDAASNPQVLQAYTDFLADQKKGSDAQKLFDQALKKLPKDATVRVLYGGFLRKAGKDKDAERQYKEAIGIASANVYAHYNLADLYLAQKKTTDAERELALAEQADPRFGPPPMLLGKVRLAQKRSEEALAEFRKALQVSVEPAQQQELRELIASSEKVVADEKNTNARSWGDYIAGLKVTPDSPELRKSILRFQFEHPNDSDISALPPSPLSAAVNTAFWKEQIGAESQWRAGDRQAAVQRFAKALGDLSPPERRIVTATAFNLRNDDFGIHQVVYRWARRFIDAKQYREALTLMDVAVRHWIYGVVPNFSPVTIDSLMSPADVQDPKTFNDFEVAHHPDPRAHEIYAAAYAGLGDKQNSNRYVDALEQARKQFPKNKDFEDALRRLK